LQQTHPTIRHQLQAPLLLLLLLLLVPLKEACRSAALWHLHL
jgi:hypothetical protein